MSNDKFISRQNLKKRITAGREILVAIMGAFKDKEDGR